MRGSTRCWPVGARVRAGGDRALCRELSDIVAADIPVTFGPPADGWVTSRRVRGLDAFALPEPFEHIEHLWLED